MWFQIFNPESGSITSFCLPTARAEHGTICFRSELYVIGGQGEPPTGKSNRNT